MLKNDDVIAVIHFDVRSKTVLDFTDCSQRNINLIYKKAIPIVGQTSKSNYWSGKS